MTIFDLPDSLEVNGTTYPIDPEYRNILRILIAFEDPELSDAEKRYVCLYNLYLDFPTMPQSDLEAAYREAVQFIDHGAKSENNHAPRLMSWEQDAPLLFPAVNKVAEYEVRDPNKSLHWWTFLGFYMEIKDSVFTTVLSLRQKRMRGEKLDKSEQQFWQANRGICVLKEKLTAEEKAEEDRLNALFS